MAPGGVGRSTGGDASRPETISPIVVFKNIGRTAAELTSGSVNVEVVSRLPEIPVYEIIFPFVPGTLLIEDARYQIPFGEYTVHLENEELASITTEAAFLWFYGYLSYQDFLGNPHQFRFCARWEAVNATGQPPRGFILDSNTPKVYLQRS
jgi:hypothetical protein